MSSTVVQSADRPDPPERLVEELVKLAVEQRQLPAGHHPLALILKDRRNRAAALSASRLLPRTSTASGHRRAELQGLAYHRAVADHLTRQDVRDARRRLARWRAGGLIDERWADRWEDLLDQPIRDIRRTISADDHAAARPRNAPHTTYSPPPPRSLLPICR